MFKRGGAGVRWIVCILLFLAGVVWGKIIPKDYPQNLESLNQIFGIMSSIATMITVAIAVYGLNAWRQQIKGQADHQLAADLAVELVNLKEACRIGWSDARCCLLLNGNKPSPWLPGMWELEVSRLTSTLQYRGAFCENLKFCLIG